MRHVYLLIIVASFGVILVLAAAIVLTNPSLTAAAMQAVPPGTAQYGPGTTPLPA